MQSIITQCKSWYWFGYIIAGLAIVGITIGGLAYTQLSQGTKPNPKVSVNISSQQQNLPISSLGQMLSSSSQMPSSSVVVVSSTVKVEEVKSQEVKVENMPKVENPKVVADQPIQDVPTVTKLSTDKSIYHQYIRDYLACPTKFYQPMNGGYIYEGLDQYKYTCIPQSEADKCANKTLIYGLMPLIGKQRMIDDGSIFPKNPVKTIESGKFYCGLFYETMGSVSIPEMVGYGLGYFPVGLDSKLLGYYTIPKSVISLTDEFNTSKITFAAIPLTSFSQSDQEYISKNFKVNTLPNN